MNILNTHNIATPPFPNLFVLVVVGLEVLLEGIDVLVVFLSGLSQGDAGGGLLVDEGA